MRLFQKANKYGVSPADQRRYMFKTYDSKAESQYAMELHQRVTHGDLAMVWTQPRFELGCPENRYYADFLVEPADGSDVYAIDVKGTETATFKKTKRLWARYGPIALHIVKRTRSGFETVEIIEPETQ